MTKTFKPTYIYRFKDGEDEPLCIYLCNTPTKDRIVIVPLTPTDAPGTFALTTLEQYADIANFKEIDKSFLASALYIKSAPVRITKKECLAIQSAVIHHMMTNIESDATSVVDSLSMFQEIYQFVKWQQKKLDLNYGGTRNLIKIYENCLYWADIGVNIGSELNKSRPVLIWKKRENGDNQQKYSYIVIPITSKKKNKGYYMNIPIFINGQECFVRLEDMRRISINRISRPILDSNKKLIFISDETREQINNALGKFYIFNNRHTPKK